MTLDDLLEVYGTKRAVAFAFNITPQAVSSWSKLGYVPFYSQIKIEHLSGGKFKADKFDKNSKSFKTRAYQKK